MNAKHKLSLLVLALISQFMFIDGQQAERYLEIRGHAELEMNPLGNVTATLFDGNSKVSSTQTGSDGSFSFKLEANKLYTVEVSKNGMVTKKISFNTAIPDEESGIWVREFAIVLVVPCEGVDYSPLQKPVDVIRFNPKQRDFESDKNYVEGRMPKLQEIYTKSANCLSDKYDRLISQADKQFSQKTYEEARTTYQQALDIMPREVYPKKKIAEIDALLNKQKNNEDLYTETIKEADALLAQQQYSDALNKYKAAAAMNPQETYSAKKINEIQGLLTRQQAEKQSAAAAEARYNDLIAKAGQAYTQKNYEMAKKYYEDALLIKPAESSPRNKIQEIEALVEKQNQQQARQKSVDDAYLTAVAEADALYKAKNFEAAKEAYAKALAIKPSESYPRTKTQEIDKTIQQQAQDHQNARVAELNRNLESYLEEGDNQFKAKNYEAARAAYGNALKIKPDEAYAKQRIAAIDKILVNEQAARQKSVEDGYENAIGMANDALDRKQYTAAKEQYQKALGFRPDDAFAKNKIAEVDRLINEENKKLAAGELRNKQYQDAIAAADKLYQAKDFTGAISGYRQALNIKPGDAYAQQRITGIENALAAERTAKQKAIEDGYNNAISMANAALTQKQYVPAKELYQKALSFKPEDALARNKITEIDLLLKQEQDRLSADLARKKQYDEVISRADKLFASRDFGNAKTAFEEALRIMPAESYPKQKIGEIDKIVADQQKALADKQAKTLADAKAKEDAYNSAISSGSDAYSQKKYPEAKGFYNQALKIKPDDAYAKDQILLIDNLLADQEKQKLADQAKQKQYSDLIALADKAFDGGNYTVAKENYQKALAVIPDSPYPKQKIARIDEIYKLLAQQKAQNTQQAAAKKSGTQSIASATPMEQLNFKDDDERDIYLNELKKKYPEGITLEVYKERYRETRRYIIIRDNVANEFRDVLIKSYGGHDYSMNGRTVTQMYYESQVKSRPGEYYNETIFE